MCYTLYSELKVGKTGLGTSSYWISGPTLISTYTEPFMHIPQPGHDV